jgi:hypothetical protein
MREHEAALPGIMRGNQAHNLKVVSSNLAPATKSKPAAKQRGGFFVLWA